MTPDPKNLSKILEQLLIFTRGGLILWTCNQISNALKGSPIDTLIRSVLLEERSADDVFNYDAGGGASYRLKWAFDNELGLVFVAVYQFSLNFVDDMLGVIKNEFAGIYDVKKMDYSGFDGAFVKIQQAAEARAEEMKIARQVGSVKASPAAAAKPKSNGTLRANGSGKKKSGAVKDDSEGKEANSDVSVVKDRDTEAAPEKGAFDVNRLKGKIGRGGKKVDTKKSEIVTRSKAKAAPKKKENRVWDDAPKDVKLDFTNEENEGGVEKEQVIAAAGNMGDSWMDKEEESSDSESEEEEEAAGNGKPVVKKKGWFSSMLQSIAGNAVLEKSDLEPALKALKDRLMTKNVAEEIAEKLCESVAASLEGKKLGSFTRVSTPVKAAMEEALLRILTPKRSIDILREVHDAKEQGRPYVLVFIGVNGVGKSTNLAKVAYWLKQHDVSVMLAACDTFRSGAVEQLRTHARRLEINIFEKGYEKDPAVVAKEAIQQAIRDKTDVVLVDTAGRMQDNEPLMRALSKLVNLNNPDLVLFVGEALVGNDGVDQLTKFNQKLVDLSPTKTARVIDGILLTKFDTIDDKVGAALSMVYISGAPVMFVGCGQSYTDLKKLNVKTIVKTLLK